MEFVYLLQNNTVFFYSVVAFVSLLVGSFLNVVIYRLPVMMENEWRLGYQELHDADQGRADHIAEQANTEQVNTEQVNTEQANTDLISVDQTSSDRCSQARVTEALPSKVPEPQAIFNLAKPASRCPFCDQPIRAWQNIPVCSYLLLGGKCANCSTSISPRYPIIEFSTALLCVIVAWHFGPTLQCIVGIVITWCLIVLSMIDFDHQLLPDSITLPLLWAGLVASLLPLFVFPSDAIVGAAAGYLSLWSVYQLFKLITSKEGMGYGDFKLLAALGAWFGWQALPIIILLSSLVGACVGIALMVIAKRGREVPIPFGPYLAAAGWLTMLFGEQMSSLYGAAFY